MQIGERYTGSGTGGQARKRLRELADRVHQRLFRANDRSQARKRLRELADAVSSYNWCGYRRVPRRESACVNWRGSVSLLRSRSMY